MRYFGKYERFDFPPDADRGRILSADNAVGDIYDIEIDMEDGVHKAWLVNRFGNKIGYFNPKFSRRLAVMAADWLKEKAILSFMAYTGNGEKGTYWGEMAVVCYDPAREAAFEKYLKGVSERIGDDIRPMIDFSDDAAEKIIETQGEWIPAQNIILPDQDKGKTYIKRRKRMAEKLADQGRAGNIGCYIASWAFIVIIVAAIVLGILAMMGVF